MISVIKHLLIIIKMMSVSNNVSDIGYYCLMFIINIISIINNVISDIDRRNQLIKIQVSNNVALVSNNVISISNKVISFLCEIS